MEKLPAIRLPVWMNKGEPLTLANASHIWWERVWGWLTWPLAQIDVDTCDEQLLTLLAYQRDITRFTGESLAAFRLRVKYAFPNAVDAGCKAGFERIFSRLNIGLIQQLERQLGLDWDVILIRINDEQLSRDNTLMMSLIRQYGRTCRRYFFDVLNSTTTHTRPRYFDHDADFYSANVTVKMPAPWRIAGDIFVRDLSTPNSGTISDHMFGMKELIGTSWGALNITRQDITASGNLIVRNLWAYRADFSMTTEYSFRFAYGLLLNDIKADFKNRRYGLTVTFNGIDYELGLNRLGDAYTGSSTASDYFFMSWYNENSERLWQAMRARIEMTSTIVLQFELI